MFGLLLRSELLQGSAVRTWNCVLNIANFFRYKFNSLRQPEMPRSRRRHHSRSRSRSHSHDRDREVKRRRVESPDSSHHRRSVRDITDETDEKNMILNKTLLEFQNELNVRKEKSNDESDVTEVKEITEVEDIVAVKEDIKESTEVEEATEVKESIEVEEGIEVKESTEVEDGIEVEEGTEVKESTDIKESSETKEIIEVKKGLTTPKKIMSPAQKQKRLESEKKRQLEKDEREKKRQEERMKKEEQKRKEREEKEEQRRKEREEKEEQKKKELEQKQKEIEQKKKEKELKEEQRRKEKEEKEEQKRKEKEEKEEQRRKERELKEQKKQKELDEKNRKMEKEKAAFANFFSRKSITSSSETKKPDEEKTLAFMPFEIKSDMRLAPIYRISLTDKQKSNLIDKLTNQLNTQLYLDELKTGKTLGSSTRTWPIDDDDNDVQIIDDGDIGECVEEQPKAEKMRAKLLKFHENRRPAYFGTWRKTSNAIKPRHPLALDKKYFDYEVDSDDDWEEEGPGESLHGSDDEEKENEPLDDYEVDNDFFVPHGYLSDEEMEQEEDKQSPLSPETQKEKLKLLQMEFDEEMKSKTERIKPRLIGCIWDNKLVPKVQDAINKFLGDRMIILTAPITIQKRDMNTVKLSASKHNRKQLNKELIPDFINLIHGNTNNQVIIINEFINYLTITDSNETVSKASLKDLLKQLAKWKKCPDEGAMFNKACWYVEEDVRKQYNLNLDLPNKWISTSEDNSMRKKIIF